MIEDLKPYPEYKDSGLPWLGEVAAHWGIKRGKSYLRAIDKRSNSGKEDLLTVSSTRGVVPRRNANVTMFKANSYAGHKRCWPGDLVINSLWAWNGGLGVSRHHGIASTAYGVYRARNETEVNSCYLHELLRSSAFQWELQVRSKGVWISQLQPMETAFLDAPIPLPPPEEQASIARFLAWATSRLDRAIGAKHRIITLLQEQKQAIIHRAVTRGLDPSVPLKDSGIPWLGDIPEHWEVTRVKGEFACLNFRRIPLSTIERGKMKRRQYDYYGASGIINKVEEYLFDEYLILIAEDGANLANLYLPLAIVARGKYWMNNHAHILKPRKGQLEHLAALLESMDFRPWISGAAQPKLTQDRPMGIRIAIPPPEEQARIVEAFNKEAEPITLSIRELLQEASLLREYRTRLIADVVTGKLDVREVAAGLPEEIASDDAQDATEEDLDLEDEVPEKLA